MSTPNNDDANTNGAASSGNPSTNSTSVATGTFSGQTNPNSTNPALDCANHLLKMIPDNGMAVRCALSRDGLEPPEFIAEVQRVLREARPNQVIDIFANSKYREKFGKDPLKSP